MVFPFNNKIVYTLKLSSYGVTFVMLIEHGTFMLNISLPYS